MATDQTALKRAAAARALDYVQDGMKLGLGTGSTAEVFLDLLAPRVRGGLKLLCVPTSEKTATKARAHTGEMRRPIDDPPFRPLPLFARLA